MAEGGWLPWKEQQKDIRPFPDYKDLAKPLKRPPHGLEWRRLDDGAWELRSIKKNRGLAEQPQQGEGEEEAAKGGGDKDKEKVVPEFLEHVVMPDDTLTGICMRYRVKDRELRQLNGFVGNHFRLCDTLVVPNRQVAGGNKCVGAQPQTKDVIAQRFRNASSLGGAEASYYLESNNWDLQKALAEWRTESTWEFQQKQQQQQQQQQQQVCRRRSTATSETSVDCYPAVPGTRSHYGGGSLNGDYLVQEDGTIEMGEMDDLADARVPLLSGRMRPR